MRGWIEDERKLPRFAPERERRVREMEAALEAMKDAGRLLLSAVTEVMAHAASVERSHTRAGAVILTRAYDDLNGVVLLCAEGLPVQAAALAAARWEKAHQANTVTNDPERLQAWLTSTEDFDADNPVYRNKAHVKAFEAVRDFMEIPTTWDSLVDEYRQLCNMKHGHPFVMRYFGVTSWTEKEVNLLYGPTTGGAATYLVFQVAMVCVKALQWGVLGFLLGNHDVLEKDAQIRLHETVARGFEALFRLSEKCPKLLDPETDADDPAPTGM